MGDTAGARGLVFNTAAPKDETFLPDTGGRGPIVQAESLGDSVEGALQGTCSIVTSTGKQLCTYEVFLFDPSEQTVGTIVATGSVVGEVGVPNILIVESGGDDFEVFGKGMITITYTQISKGRTVMDLSIQLKRICPCRPNAGSSRSLQISNIGIMCAMCE